VKNFDLHVGRLVASGAVVLVGGGLFLWPAIGNGYPLLYFDTGAYIWTSIDRVVPPDRPIGYGLFMLTGRLAGSLWMPIMLQATVTSGLVLRTLLLVLPGSFGARLVSGSIVLALTALTTAAARYAAYVMPDIFVAWLVLGGCLLVFGRRVDQAGGAVAIFAAELVHNENIGLGLVFAGVLFCAASALPERSWRRRAAPLAMCTLAILVASLVSLAFGGGLSVTRGGPSFFLNRLSGGGVLTQVLATYCPDERWQLCAYQDVIAQQHADPWWLLWADDSPLQRIGWEQGGGEQSDVVAHALRCCFPAVLESGLQLSWQQLWQFRAQQDLPVLAPDSSAYKAVQTAFPREFAAFLASDQESGSPVRVEIMSTDDPRVFACFLGLAGMLAVACWALGLRRVAACLLVASVCVVINAFVGAFANGTVDRQQGRIAWMIPLWVFAAGVALAGSIRLQRPSRRNTTMSVLSTMARSNNAVRWRM
jgi:hypothetical protein